MISMTTWLNACKSTIANGGCTLQCDGTPVTQGYAVASGSGSLSIPRVDIRNPFAKSVYPLIANFLYVTDPSLEADGNPVFGMWVDDRTAQVVIETVEIYEDREFALSRGRLLNQYSILDLANNQEILCKEEVNADQNDQA